MQAGERWEQLWRETGIVGSIRALEVTHGPNGFHPHLHVLFLADALSESRIEALRDVLSVRWQSAVSRALGMDHIPLDRRGCDLRPSCGADYIAKLGLEVAGSPSKSARHHNTTPLDIAESGVEHGCAADIAVWKAFCAGMRGARMLTWSHGLKKAVGITERSDEEIAEEHDNDLAPEIVAHISGTTWDQIARVNGASIRVLRAAETTGPDGVNRVIAALLGQHSQSFGKHCYG